MAPSVVYFSTPCAHTLVNNAKVLHVPAAVVLLLAQATQCC